MPVYDSFKARLSFYRNIGKDLATREEQDKCRLLLGVMKVFVVRKSLARFLIYIGRYYRI